MSRRTIPVEFEELKDSGNLPSPAGVGLRVLEITRTDDYSAEDMGEAIMSDPALTGRILELANSAERAGQESITTVSGAIMRLGATTVRNLALAFSLVSEREAGSCRPFDYERYWSLCLARAVAAKAISVEIENITPEEAYVAGLLGEIGILALASVHSERYGRLLVEYEGRSLGSIRDAELAAFDIDHPTIGECMLRDWGLPESFGAAVADFCVKRAVTPVTARLESLADLLRFADVIASALLFGEDSPPEHVTEVGESLDCVRDVLAYEAPEFDRMCDAISHEWRSWGERLEITTRDVRFSRVRKEIAEGRERYAEEKRARATGRATRRKPTLLPPEPRSPVVDDEERISILAVDDDPVSLRILVRFLRRARFDVTMARSGKEGLKKALQEKPDLIIVDYEMPGMSGLDVVKALRRSSLGSSLYILLLTGNDEDELLVDAFDAGVDDFVNKPFQPRVLTARMQAGIRIARLQRKVDRDRRTILKQLAEKNALNRKLRTASLTDSLTGLANRRHAMNRIETEWMSSERTGSPFSLIMLDVDHFKRVNDEHGHDVGDLVLQATASTVRSALRGEDEVFRLGGEEFLVLCRNATERDGAIVADRIRKAVAANVVHHPGFERAVTISLGVAAMGEGVQSVEGLLKAADDAVYQAKNSGRNTVCVAGAQTSSPDDSDEARRSA